MVTIRTISDLSSLGFHPPRNGKVVPQKLGSKRFHLQHYGWSQVGSLSVSAEAGGRRSGVRGLWIFLNLGSEILATLSVNANP